MIAQEVLNYETIAHVTGGGDATCRPVFEALKEQCDINLPPDRYTTLYCQLLSCSAEALERSYERVCLDFAQVSDDTVVLSHQSPLWPAHLTGIPWLYLRGNVELLTKKGLSVVGTRNPSARGKELTRACVNAAGKAGLTIISGLAMGIDGIAHIQALASDFPTIGVIGTPINMYYPKEHQRLQDLVSANGLLISQFSPSRPVQRYYFMQRNQLMSRIACGSLVVEDRDGGGGVKQAQYSQEQGKSVYILKEVYENRTYLWPRSFSNPVLLKKPEDLASCFKAAKKPVEKVIQPELF